MGMRYRSYIFKIISIAFLYTLNGNDLNFIARPYQVTEGDAVVFTYLADKSTVKPNQIQSWKWDFQGDGVWDVEETVKSGETPKIQATWYSEFDEVLDTNQDGVITFKPILEIKTIDNQTIPQVGITEDVFGLDGQVDEEFSVKARSAGNAHMITNFSASPRMIRNGEKVRFYSDAEFVEGVEGKIWKHSWDVDGDGSEDYAVANPEHYYPDVTGAESRNVTLTVFYTLADQEEPEKEENWHQLAEIKQGYIRQVALPESLALGRSYRRGFPETYTWEDIIKAYSARGAGNNRYVYFDHFVNAFFDFQDALTPAPNEPNNRLRLAETVNEILQGQTLIANKRLIEALRIKYPRMASIDPDNPPEKLSPPAGAREETAAIDTALLDYELSIQYAASAIQRFGLDILRSKAPEGKEPFPQFPRYLTIEDPTLSGAPIPIKNEYWQLATAMERTSLGRMEKAKKLFRLSAQDTEKEAREEAKQSCKVTGMQSYLGMALLAAGQSEDEFQMNGGNTLRAHMQNARNLFESINAGENPINSDGSFIPNESFAATLQDAQEAVSEAQQAEIHARQEERTWEQYQSQLRSELLSQRNSYLTPLKNLTSIDPALYNDLQTVNDQRDYRLVVDSRLKALEEDYKGKGKEADPSIIGELGEVFLSVKNAEKEVESAKNDMINLFKSIDLAKWGNTKIKQINSSAQSSLLAADVLKAYGEGTGLGKQPWLTAAGLILERTTQFIQQSEISDVHLEQEIRNKLLNADNLRLATESTQNNLRSRELALKNSLARMDRLIEDLSHTRQTAADLYFMDPSFQIVVSDAMRRAEAELDYAIDRLYRLARTLEYEWTESYQNPIIVPVNSGEPASLENPLFDKFTERDSLFFVRDSNEAKDYLDALKAWDSKLRRINIVSVRGPNHSAPISAEPISIREEILGLSPDPARDYSLGDSIRDFRNYLETQREAGTFNEDNPTLVLDFATTIADNRFFPATGARWNMRVNSIAVDIYAESGFSNKQVAEIDLIQSGMVTLRRFFAEPPVADDLFRLTQYVDNIDRTAYAVAFPAKINGATANRPPTEFINSGLANRPIAATKWILRIDTENPTNEQIDFSKLKDIVLHFTYTYGNPAEFANF